MPTGYTAGILDGTTKDFNQFAKHCMRAFGACMHMRDEDFNSEYKEQKISNYHQNKLKELKKELISLSKLSNEEAFDKMISELTKQKEIYTEYIEKAKESYKTLNKFLLSAKQWNPPSDEHHGIKDFMVQQLSDTINQDADTSYYSQKLSDILLDIVNADGKSYKENRSEKIRKEIIYHTEELKKETDRVIKANLWVKEFIKSL